MNLRTPVNYTSTRITAVLTVVFIAYSISLAAGLRGASGASTAGRSHAAVGITSRVVSVKEKVGLKVTKAQGTTLDSSGRLSGTLNGSVTLTQAVVSSERATGVFVAYLNGGGSIRGRSAIRYHTSGSVSRYTGTIAITGGTGRYAHASAAGLQLSGTYNRVAGRINLSLGGQLHL